MIRLILYTVVPVYLLISAAYAVHPAVVEIISKVQLQAHSHAFLPHDCAHKSADQCCLQKGHPYLS